MCVSRPFDSEPARSFCRLVGRRCPNIPISTRPRRSRTSASETADGAAACAGRRTGSSLAVPRCRGFGLRVPILLAPVAGACPPALSVAVARAGGAGACGTLLMSPAEMASWAAAVRRDTDGPFQMDLWVPDPAPHRDTEQETRVRDFLARCGPPAKRRLPTTVCTPCRPGQVKELRWRSHDPRWKYCKGFGAAPGSCWAKRNPAHRDRNRANVGCCARVFATNRARPGRAHKKVQVIGD